MNEDEMAAHIQNYPKRRECEIAFVNCVRAMRELSNEQVNAIVTSASRLVGAVEEAHDELRASWVLARKTILASRNEITECHTEIAALRRETPERK